MIEVRLRGAFAPGGALMKGPRLGSGGAPTCCLTFRLSQLGLEGFFFGGFKKNIFRVLFVVFLHFFSFFKYTTFYL